MKSRFLKVNFPFRRVPESLNFRDKIFGDLKQNPTFLKLNLTFEKQTLKEFF